MNKIKSEVIDAIRKHQKSMIRPMRECVGLVVIEHSTGINYLRLPNRIKGDHRFKINGRDLPTDYRRMALVHSHPAGTNYPSSLDLAGVAEHHRKMPYGIYSVFLDDVYWYRIDKNRVDFEVINVEVIH